jgi:glutamyl-tRNA synthetase
MKDQPSGSSGRYAPSPTGSLHLGNLRTALLAWLFARRAGAAFRMRVEDLDPARVRPGSEEEQLADLAALGLDWDEPVMRQSERLEAYAEALAALEREGRIYPCFCTRAEIREAASAPHGEPGAYPGTCWELTAAERAERERSGRPPALRFRAAGVALAVEDEVAGRHVFTVDDPVVRRNDGAFAYQLAAVADDAAQEIGLVVRGDDLLPSAARQQLLAGALGVASPRWAHVPLMLGPDGARLAKRHGAVTLAERRAHGETPEQVRGQLAASVGLADPGETPSLAELLARFDPATIPRAPTVLAAG